MNRFYYLLYNYIISSNVELNLLSKVNEKSIQNKKMITIEINYNLNFSNKTHGFTYMHKNNQFFGKIKTCNFCIDYEKFLITAETCDVYSTAILILNIPISFLLLYDGKLLLHSSSCIHKDKLYIFIGEKGQGKSTLNVFLSQCDDFHLFSDDSVCIDVETNKIYPSYNFLKLTRETEKILKNTKKSLEISATKLNRIKNKRIYRFQRKQDVFSLNATRILFVHRSNEILKKDLQCDILKINYLSQNIVGENYFNQAQKELSRNLVKNMVENNVLFVSHYTVADLNKIDYIAKKYMINQIIV